MKRFLLGIDIGGSKVAGGLVTSAGKMTDFQSEPTARGLRPGLSQVVGMISRLLQAASGGKVTGIGISAPGPLDARKGLILSPPNLPGWRNVPLARQIQKRFGLPTRLENDANAAGLAESLFGAARGLRHVLYITVSTGIGTGIIIDGRIYHGRNGLAGEGGHVSIDYASDTHCGCGSRGCIEALASGPAMARRAQRRLEQNPRAGRLLREIVKDDLECVSAEVIARAAARGDLLARSVIEESAYYLGIWLAGMINVLDPEAVVIGGGISRIGQPFFRRVRQTVRKHAYILRCIHAQPTPILAAKLGAQVGVFGAASLFNASSPGAETNLKPASP